MNKDKIKLTTYYAGFIESNPEEASTWRKQVDEELSHPDLQSYDPVQRESQKTGKPAGKHVEYVVGLKKSGRWDQFISEMNKIWLGNIQPNYDLIEIFKLLRYRKVIDGNEKYEMDTWADYEAVIRSDFIIAYMRKDVQTVGTIIEIFLAMLFKIPVYLMLDAPKTETNSTLLMMVLYSGGEIFYNLKDCTRFIKSKYKLNTLQDVEKLKKKEEEKCK